MFDFIKIKTIKRGETILFFRRLSTFERRRFLQEAMYFLFLCLFKFQTSFLLYTNYIILYIKLHFLKNLQIMVARVFQMGRRRFACIIFRNIKKNSPLICFSLTGSNDFALSKSSRTFLSLNYPIFSSKNKPTLLRPNNKYDPIWPDLLENIRQQSKEIYFCFLQDIT